MIGPTCFSTDLLSFGENHERKVLALLAYLSSTRKTGSATPWILAKEELGLRPQDVPHLTVLFLFSSQEDRSHYRCIHHASQPPRAVCVYWEFGHIWEFQTLSKCLLCKMDTKECSRSWKEKWLFVFLCWMKRGQKSFCSSTKEPIKQKQNTRVPRVQQQGGSALGLRSVTTWQHWVGAKVFSVLCMLEGSALKQRGSKNVTEEENHAHGRGVKASGKTFSQQRG